MIEIFSGSDTYSRSAALAARKAELDADGMLSTNTATFEAARTTVDEVMAAGNTIPFLAAYRLVVIEGLLGGFEKSDDRRPGGGGGGGRKLSAEEQSKWLALAAYSGQMPPQTVVILLDDDVAASNALLKALKAATPPAKVRDFPLPKGQGVAEWVGRVAKERGIAIEPPAVAQLANLVGPNTELLARELEKLALYAEGRPIVRKDVDDLSPHAREANVFALVDAVAEGRIEPALRLLRELLAGGATPPYINAMIVRQYRNMLLAKELAAGGASPQEVGRQIGVFADYAIRRLLEQTRRYTPAGLDRAYRRLVQADASIKRGDLDEEPALELMVAELCRSVG